MTRQETGQIMDILKAAYPNTYNRADKAAIINVLNLWSTMFSAEPVELVAAAVKAWIAADTKGFHPPVGAIKEHIQRLTAPQALTEFEAWGIVMRAASNAAYNSVEEYGKLSALLRQIIGSPSALKGIGSAESDALPVLQSNFMRSYREKVAQEQEKARMPEDIRRLVDGNRTKKIGD